MIVEVKNYSNAQPFRVLAKIQRQPRTGKGWLKVRYLNRWFQVWGGVSNNFYIDLANPFPNRAHRTNA